MIFNNYEMKKLFDFILINKNIILSDYGLFSRDTLILLKVKSQMILYYLKIKKML